MAVQQGRSERRGESYSAPYVEPLSDATCLREALRRRQGTPLADFFSILLDGERPAARCAYLPFGAGPWVCVGTHFATIEGPLLLALIGRHYDLQLAQETVEPELMVTLRPKGGIRMTIQPRQAPVASRDC